MNRLLAWWIDLQLHHVVVLGFIIVVGLTALCAVFVHFAESWDWIDAVYFSVTSLTTVGYGDFVPTNDATKIFLIFFLPAGVAVWLITAGAVGAKLIELERRRVERMRDSPLGAKGRGRNA